MLLLFIFWEGGTGNLKGVPDNLGHFDMNNYKNIEILHK